MSYETIWILIFIKVFHTDFCSEFHNPILKVTHIFPLKVFITNFLFKWQMYFGTISTTIHLVHWQFLVQIIFQIDSNLLRDLKYYFHIKNNCSEKDYYSVCVKDCGLQSKILMPKFCLHVYLVDWLDSSTKEISKKLRHEPENNAWTLKYDLSCVKNGVCIYAQYAYIRVWVPVYEHTVIRATILGTLCSVLGLSTRWGEKKLFKCFYFPSKSSLW
jgi:hypothetical protein